jgi:hypothetical protein
LQHRHGHVDEVENAAPIEAFPFDRLHHQPTVADRADLIREQVGLKVASNVRQEETWDGSKSRDR